MSLHQCLPNIEIHDGVKCYPSVSAALSTHNQEPALGWIDAGTEDIFDLASAALKNPRPSGSTAYAPSMEFSPSAQGARRGPSHGRVPPSPCELRHSNPLPAAASPSIVLQRDDAGPSTSGCYLVIPKLDAERSLPKSPPWNLNPFCPAKPRVQKGQILRLRRAKKCSCGTAQWKTRAPTSKGF
jgi:hypothetical protein